jgi:hypothetical protein
MLASAFLLLSLGASPSLDVADAIRVYNAASPRPVPALNKGELRALRKGKVVRRFTAPKKPGLAAGVLGLVIADVPRDELWLTIRDGHLAVSEGLTERHISGRYDQPDQVWFGLLNLPAPFNSRHWRIRTRTQVAIAKKTGGSAWESTWARMKDGADMNRRDAAAGKLAGISADELEDSVYTVENHGSWLVVELTPTRTLLVYRATADLGGAVPRELVSAYAHLRLKQLLRGTLDQVILARPHYVEGHSPIAGGDGRPMPRYRGGRTDPSRSGETPHPKR